MSCCDAEEQKINRTVKDTTVESLVQWEKQDFFESGRHLLGY